MVANGLASNPQTAMNPEQLTIEHLLAAAQAATASRTQGGKRVTTVASRTFPARQSADAAADLGRDRRSADAGKDGPARTELLAVAGVAASIIADQAPKDAAIIVDLRRSAHAHLLHL